MPTGYGLRVSAKLTTMPEKKKGSARARANSAQTTSDITEAGKLVTMVNCTKSANTVARAKPSDATLRWKDKCSGRNVSERRYTQTAPAVSPNMAMLITKKAK